MAVRVPPNQIVAAFLPKVLNRRIPELAEFCNVPSISQLLRKLVAKAIEDMDSTKRLEVVNDRLLTTQSD
jgi:hypothetical protein